MSDWQITTLGEIINTGNGLIQTGPFGSQLHASDYVSLGVPVIMPINLVDNRISLDDVAYITDDDANRLAKHILKAGDIVYSRRGDVTRKALITEKEEGMFCGTGCLLIRPGYKVESKFLAYFLSTPSSKEWIIRHAVGATMPNLNTSILSKVPLLLPDFSMQKRIAKILGDLDNKITLNRQINQTLEAMAQALFKSWFVDFDPVKAKLSALAAGGSANDANLAAMSAISGKTTEQLLTLKTTHPDQFQQLYTTADLFPSEMVDSELGEIPKGWEVSEIGKEVTVVGGGTPSTSNSDFWENGDVFWATPKDLSSLSDKVIIDTERKITQQGLSKISSGLLPVNTVLMSSRAPVGYLALAKVPVAINQGFIAMKCDNKLSTEYVIQWCIANMDEIQQRASGTTFLEISKKNFNPIGVVVPTQNVLNNYSQVVKNYYVQIEQNVRQTASLVDIRDALLPKLLAGDLVVDGVSDE